MEISHWVVVVSCVAVAIAVFNAGWIIGSVFTRRNWEARWADWVGEHKEATQSAFETIRATSAEDKAKGEEIRHRAAVELETLKAELLEAPTMGTVDSLLPKAELDEKLRANLTLQTKDGRVLEPLMPGDYL